MSCTLSPETIKQVTEFHGHWCPGLAIGLRAAEWALREMGRSGDEEIVTVVETDMCGVDAIQALVGCTFGKGNLIHLDYGKNAFTFHRRRDGKAARLVASSCLFGESRQELGRLMAKQKQQVLNPEEQQRLADLRAEISHQTMSAPFEELFTIKAAGPLPAKARIMNSLTCEECGEGTMESRTRRFQEKTLCIPCFADRERRL
ncbi:FmdE family protein [Desulfurivibrio dismutans]|uniref:FmdE family protein n=1 Tax=Desulfurivibrio dismutans TaxID=1398908 RepID=UPI0023DB700A|nr:FmdE family protein [Desulfurivibrio alkaliphilus]MDF1615105.1 FmdE family protein [Desulfurivibrio alkaliphilus]